VIVVNRLFVAVLMVAVPVLAETWSGTLVDVMCKGRDLASHTTKCALNCAKGGYGLVLGDGKFVKFDESGNARALAALKKSTKEKDLKAKVSGTLDGDIVKVASIELQ
jgi:hypothetical protein